MGIKVSRISAQFSNTHEIYTEMLNHPLMVVKSIPSRFELEKPTAAYTELTSMRILCLS